MLQRYPYIQGESGRLTAAELDRTAAAAAAAAAEAAAAARLADVAAEASADADHGVADEVAADADADTLFLAAAAADREAWVAAAAAADAELTAASARAAALRVSEQVVPSTLDTTAIEARLRHVTAGPWRRHGCDVWADGAPGVPLFTTPRERDSSGAARAQADRDADFVAHAFEDIRGLLDELRSMRG